MEGRAEGVHLVFMEGGPNNCNYYCEKRKFSLNLIALTCTLFCFGIGGMGSWHVILTAALWKVIANDPTYNMQL